MQSRALCFTLNHPSREEYSALIKLVGSQLSYLVMQLEKGESGTIHLQGYAELTKPLRFAEQKLLFPRAHLETRRGTQQQAIDYCQKAETRIPGTSPEIHGIPRVQGARSDLENLAQRIVNGTHPDEIMKESPATWCRNYRSLDVLFQRSRNANLRQWPTTVLYFYGSAGSGKSREAFAIAPAAYRKCPSHRWWDGYYGQPDVVIEDMASDSALSINMMLRLMDRYPLQVEVKGGLINFAPHRMIITSNFPPEALYPSACKESMAAFKRRLTQTKLFGEEPLLFERVVDTSCQCPGCTHCK